MKIIIIILLIAVIIVSCTPKGDAGGNSRFRFESKDRFSLDNFATTNLGVFVDTVTGDRYLVVTHKLSVAVAKMGE